MRTISSAMQTLLNSDSIDALATFWKITRKDGTVLGFTDWSSNVTAGSPAVVYEADSGVSRSALQQRVDLAVPNQELSGILTSDTITSGDIRAGKYNGAQIECFMAVPTDSEFAAYGTIRLPGAYVGEVTIQDGMYVAEMRGLTYLLQQTFINVYVPTCRADFADSDGANLCKLVASNYIVTGAITTINTANFTFTSTAVTGPGLDVPAEAGVPSGIGVFSFGQVKFTSGQNEGFVAEITQNPYAVANHFEVTLYVPTPYPMTVGDEFTALTGCSKTVARCIQYGNSVNHRGTPAIPGLNMLFQVGSST